MTATNSLEQIRQSVTEDRQRIFEQLSELIAFNSVHNEPALQEDTRAAASWVSKALEEVGVNTEQITTDDGSIAIVGTREVSPDAPTVLLYSHYDIVPVGNREAWKSDPLTLTEREHADGSTRWYARGAADCKGNLVMHLAALRAVDAAGGPAVNIKVLIEGSEEQGGEGLSALIEQRPELFAADAILIADAGNVSVGKPTLTTALRGGSQIRVQVDTLHAPIHSGQFGGAAPDAVKALVRTLDSLHDEQGRINIDNVDCTGVWDGEEYPREAFFSDAQMLEGTTIMGASHEKVADMIWARPAVSITGFSSTPVEEAVNAVPATASAMVNLRVPANMDTAEVAKATAEHLEKHTPWGAQVTAEILEINRGFSTDPAKPALATLGECLQDSYSQELSLTGMGGSIPLTVELQEAHPNAKVALFGVEEPKCTIHSANESVDPTEIENIAIAEALFLQRYSK